MDCSICLNTLNISIITLPCNHSFHNSCFNEWKKYNNNCPYCRYNLDQSRSPSYLFDELISSDGNIDNLNERNFHYFYYLNENSYNKKQILEFIEAIKLAKILKLSLKICEEYIVKGYNIHKIGKLIKIYSINFQGIFTCKFITSDGKIFYGYNNMHEYKLIE
jgi:hypothetical protein